MDANNDKELVSKEAVEYWKNVDFYLGGAEHATGHLLYVRFWTKFLYDMGVIPMNEPAQKLINQGMIQGVSECAPIFGLSEESKSEVETNLQRLLCSTSLEEIKNLHVGAVSSVRFAIELLMESMNAINPFAPFCVDANPIPINGLVWMNDIEKMLNEAISKWRMGFKCIKFNINYNNIIYISWS